MIDDGNEPAQMELMPVSKHRRKGKTRAICAIPPREREDDGPPPTAKELMAVFAAVADADADFGGEYYPAPTARSVRVFTRLKEMYGENVADWTDEQANAALAELRTKNRAA